MSGRRKVSTERKLAYVAATYERGRALDAEIERKAMKAELAAQRAALADYFYANSVPIRQEAAAQ